MNKHIVDYTDFQQQGAIDILRAEKLYEEGDYGFAAYSAQQALEKYTKAYLMKFTLIEDPKKLGHLNFGSVLGIMLQELKSHEELSKEIPFVAQLLQILINYTSGLKNIFDNITNSTSLQHALWKESMGIQTSKLEQDLSQGILSNIQKIYLQTYQDIGIILSATFFSELSQALEKAPEERAEVAKSLLQIIQEVIQSPEKYDMEKLLEKVSNDMLKLSYGTGPNSLSKKDTNFIINFLRILHTFVWIGPIITSYPHEQISRYPTQIGDENSIILYTQNKEKLLEFIQTTKLTCEQIRCL